MSAHEIRRPAYAPIRRTTTGATVTSVLRIPLASGEGAELDVGVIAVRRATGVPSFFRRVLRVQNVAGTVTAVSMTATPPDDLAYAYAVSYTVSGLGVELTITGITAQTVDWTINPVALTR